MAEHLTHTGVHDHGFNNISTYGHLRRLMLAGRIEANEWELQFLRAGIEGERRGAGRAVDQRFPMAATYIPSTAAIRCSLIRCALCASAPWRIFSATLWLASRTSGSICSAGCWRMQRLPRPYNIYYGEGRDHYDVPELRGRTAHEAIFNPASGVFRCPSSQQGYSPFTTWTRGLAWAMLGFAEQLEFILSLPESEFAAEGLPAKRKRCAMLERAARATCDFYIHQASALDGICYWDTGAPQLASARRLETQARRSLQRLRACRFIGKRHRRARADPSRPSCSAMRAVYMQAGLTVIQRLLQEPYLSIDPASRRDSVAQRLPSPQRLGLRFLPRQRFHVASQACGGTIICWKRCFWSSRLADSSYYTFF